LFNRKRQAKVAQELEEAAKDTRAASPDRLSGKEAASLTPGFSTALPQRVLLKFVSLKSSFA
jgi:hypothetical protein